METKDRTQASYNLVDINEQTRIDFEKCKETREQKIKRLKKLKNKFKQDCKANKHTIYAMYVREGYKKVRQELKELGGINNA